MNPILSILAGVVAAIGISAGNVILFNHTGLKIVRIEIDDRRFEDISNQADGIVINVTPHKHDMKVTFKGGGHIDWADFDFKGVHQITFERIGNKIDAHFQ